MRLLNEVRARIAAIFTNNGVGGIDGVELGETLADLADNIENRSAWAPVLALVNDGNRRCIQIVDWVGSVANLNPKPAVGYIGASGIVPTLAAAVDFGVSGPKGDPGTLTASAFPNTSINTNKYYVLQNGTTLERINSNLLPIMDNNGNLGIPGAFAPANGLNVLGGLFSSILSGNGDGSYPATVNVPGQSKLSLAGNWIPGLSDLALISSNLATAAISFWQMTSVNTRKLLLILRDGRVGIGTIQPEATLHVEYLNPTGGVLTILKNNTSGGVGSGATGARLQFSQRDVGFWEVGVDGESSTFIIKGWNYQGTFVEMARITNQGKLGIGTSLPTSQLHVNGMNGYTQFRLEKTYTPTGTADPNGAVGDICFDDNFLYRKGSAGWKRAAMTTF